MKPRRSALPVLAAAAPLVAAAPARAQSPEPPPRPFLRRVVQLDDQKPAATDKGLFLIGLLRTRIDPPTGMLGRNLNVARDRLAAAK